MPRQGKAARKAAYQQPLQIIDEGPAEPKSKRRVDYTPYQSRLRQSYDQGTALAALIPSQALGAFRSRMQTAAELEGLGVAISDGPAETAGMTRVVYQAKERKVRTPEARRKQSVARRARRR